MAAAASSEQRARLPKKVTDRPPVGWQNLRRSLSLLQAVFRACGAAPIEADVRARPMGKYARLFGFYYELVTGHALDASPAIGGNYVEALPPDAHVVSPRPRRNRRWRVMDNLLGDRGFCPVVRRAPEPEQGLAAPLQAELQQLVDDFPPELFQLASDYLCQRIHCVCPPPQFVPTLMAGLANCAERAGLHPIIHAALVAFGFVFSTRSRLATPDCTAS